MRRAFCTPTRRIRCVIAPSAPRSISGSWKVASSDAITMSAAPEMPMPPPMQKPWTAEITGTGQS